MTVYADCHGLNKAVYQRRVKQQKHWGEIGSEQEESSGEEEESSEEELVSDEDMEAFTAGQDVETMPEPVGVREMLFKKPEDKPAEQAVAAPSDSEDQQLFTVLPQIESKIGSSDVYGTSFTYQMPSKQEDIPEPPKMPPPPKEGKEDKKKKKQLDFKF